MNSVDGEIAVFGWFFTDYVWVLVLKGCLGYDCKWNGGVSMGVN